MALQQHQRLVAEQDAESRQIKSRERVIDLAEVYTHEREIDAMLDLVPDMFPSVAVPGNTDRLFFEPACGNGNFLVKILRRKLAFVTARRYGRGERFEHRTLRCLASIYGIDISDDNIREARARMQTVITGHIACQLGSNGATAVFEDAVNAILDTNIIRADTLADGAEIEMVEYQPCSAAAFIREWSHPLDATENEPNLFSLIRRDEVPVHYSQLAHQTEPVRSDSLDRQAA